MTMIIAGGEQIKSHCLSSYSENNAILAGNRGDRMFLKVAQGNDLG